MPEVVPAQGESSKETISRTIAFFGRRHQSYY